MHFVVALLLILSLGWQHARADEDPNYLYSMSFRGGPTVTRYAKPEFAEGLRSVRPDGVSFNWAYRAPSEADAAAFDREVAAINDVITEVLKSQPSAVLALTSIKANNQGIWAFYTDDGRALAAALEAGLKGRTATPLRFRVGKDPEWKAFTSFVARLRDEK